MKKWIDDNKLVLSLILFSIAIGLFVLTFVKQDSDYLWHVKAGEYIFDNGILKKDVFSWYLQGKYWMSHEWLFEVLIYGFSLLFPSFHIAIYSGFCILFLLLFLLLSNKKGYLKNINYSLIWIAWALILVFFVQARPHLLSFSFLAIAIWVLYDLYCNEKSKRVYILPFITVLWSNYHGGSSNLSYLFCFLFLFAGLFNFKFGKVESTRLKKNQLLRYFYVACLCIVAVCINVHGIKMLFYPYQNMLDTTMLNNIAEWQPTTLNKLSNYLYYLLLLFIIGTMLVSKKRIKFIDLLLLMVSCYLGIKSIRFWPYTYIIMSYVIFNYVEKRKVEKRTIKGIILFSILLIFLFGMSFDRIRTNLQYRYLNDEVINIIKKEKVKRLFNMYDYGGELINNAVLVFIDGRADLYSKYNYKDYLKISKLEGDYVKLIKKYDFDYFLVDNKYPIYTYLKYSSDYETIYENDKFTLYKKIG